MQVDENVGRIEQHDEVLGEIGQRVDTELSLGERDRACLGDAEGGAHDGDIDIVERGGLGAGDGAVAD